MLDVPRLRAFRSVVACGSIQAAADTLGFTPSAISQQVAALQRETGVRLIARVGRGVEPTAAGLTLADRIDGVLSELGEVDQLVSELRGGQTGDLTLAYFSSVGTRWLPDVVRMVATELPDVRLRLRLHETFDPAATRFDVQAVVLHGESHVPVGFHLEHLLDDPYVVALPAGHRLADQSEVAMGDLADEPWIDSDPAAGPCRQVVLDACAAAGFCPSFRVEAHDYATALAFVATGIGVSVMPRLGSVETAEGVVMRPVVSPVPTRSIHLVTHESTRELPAVQRVVQLFRTLADAA